MLLEFAALYVLLAAVFYGCLLVTAGSEEVVLPVSPVERPPLRALPRHGHTH